MAELGLAVDAAGPDRPHPLQRWADLYGKSVRTIEAWKGAPLDQPHRMAQWWREHKKVRVPDKLLDLESTGPQRAAPAVVDPFDLGSVEAATPAESLEQARTITAACWHRLREAMERGDASGVSRWQSAWDRAQDVQRRWEKDVSRIQREQGEAFTVAELSAELIPRLETVKKAFAAELANHLPAEKIKERLAVVFTGLQDCRFLGGAGSKTSAP